MSALVGEAHILRWWKQTSLNNSPEFLSCRKTHQCYHLSFPSCGLIINNYASTDYLSLLHLDLPYYYCHLCHIRFRHHASTL
ncbi:hypothetical protein CDL12_17807 [Handroanthus impetiginosus]|uniref:Uncharacterized protein n=1 Tax=Handroanthus impetiginosus TaxID=429701 RepID=A0A2G9GE40_9LAMI|nr:hypothetical protein CDL12_23927 [Handroanthus impetiginosus]PIN09599.1 hypothetical protein CDL12_17807 [Handroanthus impetiginosus]